ncbi:MAG: hypothetical protein IPI73_13810 [Betaproteobacteria bacterium]|nr:hypothetical protein [Betaproteobacteria bacterium]
MRTDDGGVQSFLQDDIRGLRVGDRIQLSSQRETRYATGERRYDAPGGRVDEGGLRRETLTYSIDARGQRYDFQGYRVDERGYRIDDRAYRVEDRGFRRDGQGYWVDARGTTTPRLRHERSAMRTRMPAPVPGAGDELSSGMKRPI